MERNLYKNVFGDDGLGINFEDLALVPGALLEVFQMRVGNYEERLMRLMDQFAVAIYKTHIQGSLTAMLKGDTESAKMLVEQAEPGPIKHKALAYAKIVSEQEYTIILEVLTDMKKAIKLAKETKGGIN